MVIDGTKLFQSAKVMTEAYEKDPEFKKATISSILSAIRELKGSHSDEEVAEMVADRIFNGN